LDYDHAGIAGSKPGTIFNYRIRARFLDSRPGDKPDVPPVQTSSAAFGQVVERVLYSMAVQRPIKGEDLDNGREIEVPAELEKAREEQFFHWLSKNGVDLLAVAHERSWDLIVGAKLVRVPTLTWEQPKKADLLAALAGWEFTKARVQRAELGAKQGFIPFLFDADANVPITFAFETSAGGLGVLQITGFSENPRGVKIRYKLAQYSTSSATNTASQSSGSPIPESEKAATSAAGAWLALVDDGSYSQSWNEAAAIFRGGVTEKDWAKSMETFRKPLGDLVSRKVKTTQRADALPGAPDGSYVIMQFDTSFTGKKSAVETVTFALEKDGKWKAAGYFIK
jgi:hypothetical protein